MIEVKDIEDLKKRVWLIEQQLGSRSFEIEDLNLAQKISAVLHDPHLPTVLYNGIMRAIGDVFNEHCDQEAITEHEESVDYIARVLDGFGGERVGGEASSV